MVKAGLYHGINGIGSSSMGRLFDAISALLGICMENSYEGECAIMLENSAARAKKLGLIPHKMVFMYIIYSNMHTKTSSYSCYVKSYSTAANNSNSFIF